MLKQCVMHDEIMGNCNWSRRNEEKPKGAQDPLKILIQGPVLLPLDDQSIKHQNIPTAILHFSYLGESIEQFDILLCLN